MVRNFKCGDIITKTHRFETRALHAGNYVDETFARATPVHRSSAFLFRDTEHAADLFNLKERGNIYTRLMNPTQDVLERRMASLEGGAGSLAVASGTSAIFYSVINVCRKGDEVVSARNLYGGTYTMFDSILPDFGIRVKFVDQDDPDAVGKAITDRTRALYTETIGNPLLDVANIRALAGIAKDNHIPLIVDSTFTTPYLFRPIEHGTDIVVHSLTKWLGGHGTGIGGIVIEGGKFDWTDEKFAMFNEPDASYHGLRWAHDLGESGGQAFLQRMRLVPLRNLGACISPDNAWLFLQGIETLALRMQRHCDNARKVAGFLNGHPNVEWVRYPGLKGDPYHSIASGQFENGFGGMVVFGIRGGERAGARFIDSLRLISHVSNVGDAKSLAVHPATTTHSQLTDEQKAECGITHDLIRLSVGIEHADDIIADIDAALKSSGGN
jgi:O-acetylhomoserine (thiol)-lyase